MNRIHSWCLVWVSTQVPLVKIHHFNYCSWFYLRDYRQATKINKQQATWTFMRSVERRYCAMLLIRISKKNQMCLRNLLTMSWSAWLGRNAAFRYCASSSWTVFCFGPAMVSVMKTYWNKSASPLPSFVKKPPAASDTARENETKRHKVASEVLQLDLTFSELTWRSEPSTSP